MKHLSIVYCSKELSLKRIRPQFALSAKLLINEGAAAQAISIVRPSRNVNMQWGG